MQGLGRARRIIIISDGYAGEALGFRFIGRNHIDHRQQFIRQLTRRCWIEDHLRLMLLRQTSGGRHRFQR
ncbi:hypothetical protein D3C79_946860 [compost metagenome]